MKKNSLYIILMFLLTSAMHTAAQCKIDNTYFKEGEELTYDLYFKYGILNSKAGSSSLSVTNGQYEGKDVYVMNLRAKSSGVAKSVFSLSDTLKSYMTKDLVPLAYMKNAHEGGDYTIERATYKYTDRGTTLRNRNIRNEKLRYDTVLVAKDCVYDMLSIVYYARTLDYDSMKKGDKKRVSFLSGRKMLTMDVEHHGIDKVSANNGKKYQCLKLIMMVNDDAFENKSEAMKVYLTNDANRIPVRIDSKLKVGSSKVILKSLKGVKN